MKSQRTIAILIMLVLISTLVLPILSLAGQPQEAANSNVQDEASATAAKARQIVERYRESDPLQNRSATKDATPALAQKPERPQWVTAAVSRSLEDLQSNREKYGVQDAAAEFRLLEAMKDGRGFMDIRLAQMVNEVPVFGGQLITHLDGQNVLRAVSGRAFKEARINTTPKLDERQAIEAAKAEFKDQHQFAEEPTAKLAILPRQLMNRNESGAALVYIVKVKLAGKGGATDGYRLFVNAKNGTVIWRLNDQHYEVGTGVSLYNGTVDIETTHNDGDGSFTLKDPGHFQSQVFDALDGNSDSVEFRGFDNYWGDQSRETAAVDAHFGVAQSWEYFYNRHSRRGADDNDTPITTYVHYRQDPDTPWNNASGGNNELHFGDGDGSNYGPFVPIDTVGHEFTHCVVDATADLVGMGESGAVNEAFADIFGTAIGFYADKDTNYQHGESKVIPGSNGRVTRDLSDPSLVVMHFDENGIQESVRVPDNWSMYWQDPNNFDNGGVHINSTIMSHAFYLMSEGGINRTSQVSVPAISYHGRTPREVAEDIFYTVLARYLTPSATFRDVARAMRQVAANDYEERSVAAIVELAWFAVGVFTEADRFYSALPEPALSRAEIVLYDPATGFGETGELNLVSGGYQNQQTYSTFATGWTHVVNIGGPIFYYNANTCQAAVGEIDYHGVHRTTSSFRFKFLGTRPLYTHVVYMGGTDIYFYESTTGKEMYIRLTPGGYQGVNVTFNPGSGWSHVLYAQGHPMFYKRDNGYTMIITGTTKRYLTQSPFWSHIVDCGMRTSGGQIGIFFYNTLTGLYGVGDINAAGYFVGRVSNRWAYTFLRPGWTQVAKVQDGLFFYDSQSAEAMTGYLLTASEDELLSREPFQAMPESYSYISSLRPYQKVAGGLAR